MTDDLFRPNAAPTPVVPVEEEWWFEPLRLTHQVFGGRIVSVELIRRGGQDVRTVSRIPGSSAQIKVTTQPH